MSSADPFYILNIPENSTVENIKKAFRELIRKHHPDINGGDAGKTAEIIEAYHAAMEKATKIDTIQLKESETLFFIKYEMFFGTNFILKSDKKVFFSHIKQLTINFRNILYSEKNLNFFDEYLSILILYIKKQRNVNHEQYLDIIYAILENFKYIVLFRKDILSGELHKDEYELERTRANIIKYFNTITGSRNYLELRSSIFSMKDSLIIDCVQAINTINSRTHRQEIFSIMSLITLFSEEDFFENWEF
ncbi:MAG: hypothetical protein A2015_12220 [Spirochaetes bacterium GWF1_31_7]|nr:MAG: hypothetical protein A2Y30_14855 [Spirochaetes bacterium GWE1_32_154]OHD49181.1 MAG: hypothetical protein A2015_12220 [Spirochaetes bacterium GWF1_31_7]OHD50234.1 MAG: hypothetical protein A2Y29_12905 [Spirochaetes bacterium GWE2_31_10]OHD76624.1 MAG: hypothetical protein A2355_13650 [Spirochaetes bacterium RIFOXYB1_FULL_32_8]HBD93984.1 hypothetical protein [Spirochaetia bacterium]